MSDFHCGSCGHHNTNTPPPYRHPDVLSSTDEPQVYVKMVLKKDYSHLRPGDLNCPALIVNLGKKQCKFFVSSDPSQHSALLTCPPGVTLNWYTVIKPDDNLGQLMRYKSTFKDMCRSVIFINKPHDMYRREDGILCLVYHLPHNNYQ